jgi:hypothetical protein
VTFRALSLLYHRVAPPGVDPWGVCPERFGEQLEMPVVGGDRNRFTERLSRWLGAETMR